MLIYQIKNSIKIRKLNKDVLESTFNLIWQKNLVMLITEETSALFKILMLIIKIINIIFDNFL